MKARARSGGAPSKHSRYVRSASCFQDQVKGVSAARRKWVNPALRNTSARRASPAWAPRTRCPPAGKIGNAKTLAISAGRQAGRMLEQAPEERGIFVANLPADLFDGCVCSLQPAFRIFDLQALDVGKKGQASRLQKASFEGASRQSRALDHFLHGSGNREMLSTTDWKVRFP